MDAVLTAVWDYLSHEDSPVSQLLSEKQRRHVTYVAGGATFGATTGGAVGVYVALAFLGPVGWCIIGGSVFGAAAVGSLAEMAYQNNAAERKRRTAHRVATSPGARCMTKANNHTEALQWIHRNIDRVRTIIQEEM